MKTTWLIIFLIVIVTTSCSKYEEVDQDCLNETLEAFEMVPYTGQEIGCEFFLELYRFRNENYFLLGSHCADIDSFPFDCDGNRLCDGNGNRSKCNRFYENSTNLGIVGISKPVN